VLRRDLIAASASAAAANAVWALTGCGAQSTGAVVEHPPAQHVEGLDAFLARVSECALACDTCVGRSIEHAAGGMTAMAACARLSRECAELCRAVIVLATSGSSRLPDLARLCAAACDECAAQCQQHASMEPACARCAEVCPACAQACRSAADSWHPA
jgi:Cys-rich four helix bundle protein (predicted Tat secretion target)